MALSDRQAMIRLFCGVLTAILVAASNVVISSRVGGSTSAAPREPVDGYGRRALAFEPNQGQTDGRVQFIARGPGYMLFLSDADAVLSLRTAGNPDGRRGVRMQIVNGNYSTEAVGEAELRGKSNYFGAAILTGGGLASRRTPGFDTPTYIRVSTFSITAARVSWNTTSSSSRALTRLRSAWPSMTPTGQR